MHARRGSEWRAQVDVELHVPPYFAECQLNVRKLLLEGLIHVLLEIGGLHIVDYCCL